YSFSKVGIDIDYESESVIDVHLHELASKSPHVVSSASLDHDIDLSIDFSSSAYMSDVSGKLRRLANLNHFLPPQQQELYTNNEPCEGFLERENFSTEIIESISPEDLQPTVKMYVDSLSSNFSALRGLLLPSSGLLILKLKSIPLQCCLICLSCMRTNRSFLALDNQEYKASIGASGAIPPLVSLLVNASSVRGKKDALTTLYKLYLIKTNKKRSLATGLVKPLVDLVVKGATKEDDNETMGMDEKAMVILNSLAEIEEEKEAIVEQDGIRALLLLLIQPSSSSHMNDDARRIAGLMLGAIPALETLAQSTTTTPRAKHKAAKLLGYLKQQHPTSSSSSPDS
ncbi:U-box domain-containing protein 4, partial [Tanacetum coccineum]